MSGGGGNTKWSMRPHRENKTEKIFEKLFKNLMTNGTKYGIIRYTK